MASSGPLLNVGTTDAYREPATIVRRGIYRLRIQVSNATVIYQLAQPQYWPGPVWGEERMLLPSSYGLAIRDRCNGVRFRSGAAGVPARVNVDFEANDR